MGSTTFNIRDTCFERIEFSREMLQSHVHVKPSCKSNVRQFLRNGVGSGYLVAVMGSPWHLWDLRGCYGMYVATSSKWHA